MDRQRAVAIVIDKAQLPELVHKMTDPRPGGAYHLGQVFLIDSGKCRSVSTFRAKTRKQQENPGQALLTEIEESIHEIFFDSTHTRKQVGDKKLCKGRVFMDEASQGSLFDAGDRGSLNRRCGRHPQRSIYQTALSKHVTWSQDGDHSLLSAWRCNHELHAAILDVEHCIRRVPLGIYALSVLVLPSRLLSADSFDEVPGIESERMFAHATCLPRSDFSTRPRHPRQRVAYGARAFLRRF